MSKKIDLTGRTFGRLTVIKEDGRQRAHVVWFCSCQCGNTVKVRRDHLTSGYISSCGCLRKEVSANMLTTHGYIRKNGITPTYRSWEQALKRCLNKNNHAFYRYGGRGITFCSRWLRFENFLEDMGEKPPGLTLGRIDNNGNYEPSNCEWQTYEAQANNTRANRLITFNGQTMTLAMWSKSLKINYGTLWDRIKYWPIEKAFTYPVKQ